MRVLVTGNAGFIGFHVARALLRRGDSVVGFDEVNSYYDPSLKEARLNLLQREAALAGKDYSFWRGDLADPAALRRCFEELKPDQVVHLAAQAGVRHSITNPEDYVRSNLVGFANILERCRSAGVRQLVYATTSSVYGANGHLPFSVNQGADHPLQFYAATKRANELMAHSYSSLFGLPTTGLRFFTVYGPWGRPDMALFIFAKKILAGEPIQLYNRGSHVRDFTYIDDVVRGILLSVDKPAVGHSMWDPMSPDPASSRSPFRILNIGNGCPVPLMDYVAALENALGLKADYELLPMQAGDVPETSADIGLTRDALGYEPQVSVQEGVARFVAWYREYYRA
jgi:UDP-glucuronate 4-epimerase